MKIPPYLRGMRHASFLAPLTECLSALKQLFLSAFACFVLLNTLSVRTIANPGDTDLDFRGGGATRWFVEQTDGKILTGDFLRRLNSDGSLETPFGLEVLTASLQPDGKLLIGGSFKSVNNTARSGIARLNADGTLDAGFDPSLTNAFSRYGVTISCTAVQTDGKVLIRGAFSELAGIKRPGLARLNADGTLDMAFAPELPNPGDFLAVQTDGKILTGRERLNSDGSLDSSYSTTDVYRGDLYCLAVQADGKVILGGTFTQVRGVPRKYIARLNTDGTLDATFDPNPDSRVTSISMQTDGKIVIAGHFTKVSDVARSGCARLNPDGGLDVGFNPVLVGSDFGDPPLLNTASIQTDGRILLGGVFSAANNTPVEGIARLLNDPVTDSLSVTLPGRIEWLRAGSSPEVQTVVFDFSADEASWTRLGAGTRIPTGWELAGSSLPARGHIRATAFLNHGVSSGFIERIIGLQPNTRPTVLAPVADVLVNENASNTVINLASVFGDAETASEALHHSITQNAFPALFTT